MPAGHRIAVLATVASVIALMACSKSQGPFTDLAVQRHGIRNGPVGFRKTQIESVFRAEGVTVFDVNNKGTGVMNIVTRQYWYEYPPDVATRHQISVPRTWDPLTEYSNSYADFPVDVDGDGWTDLFALPRQAEDIFWYQNPRGEERDWTSYLIARRTVMERPFFEDLFGDGNRELVFGQESPNVLLWAAPGDDPTQPWVTHDISERGVSYIGMDRHGLGLGDINGDGRQDIIIAAGWFEGPADPTQSPWVFHPTNWLPPECTDRNSCCADMYAYDMNGDGLADVVCTRPHNRGRWWFEQNPQDVWTAHLIDYDFSESHSARFQDLDGDSLPEIITGKRKWAHGAGGEGSGEPAVLVYYKLRQDGGDVTWDRYPVDPDETSGVGTQFEVADVNGDGLLDIIISNKVGLFYFEQIP